MAIFPFGAISVAALGIVLSTWSLGAQPAVESSSSVFAVPEKKPDLRGLLTWKLSIATLATASALDIASSWGKCEQNGLLAGHDGTFGGKGTLVKTGLVGGLIAAEWLITRKTNRTRKIFSILNFGAAAGIDGLAIRNFGIPAPTDTERCK